jgi:hypothetical protein
MTGKTVSTLAGCCYIARNQVAYSFSSNYEPHKRDTLFRAQEHHHFASLVRANNLYYIPGKKQAQQDSLPTALQLQPIKA